MITRSKAVVPTLMMTLVLALSSAARATFVSAKDFDFKAMFAPPPAEDSQQEKDEIDQLLKFQADRTDAQVARIKSENKMTGFIFSQTLGSWFNPDDLPATAAFLNAVLGDAKEVAGSAKEVFHRRRPFLIDSRIKPVTEKEKTFSYPSSHSTRGMLLALILSQMFPDQKDALITQGKTIGNDRAIAGQHFPSDVAAGRILAQAIFDKMMQNPDFQAQLEKAKAECHAKELAAH